MNSSSALAAPAASLLYAPNDAKLEVLAGFAAARAAEGVVVDGVLIETTWLDPRTKGGLVARRLAGRGAPGRETPETAALTRPYTEGIVVGRWQLLPEGVAAMADMVQAAIAPPTELLLVDKFGPLEGRGGGLAPVLAEALARPIPLVVAVRAEFDPAWRAFVAAHAPARLDRLSGFATDAARLEAWWREARSGATAPA
jgi:hypothetical protein